MVQAYCAGATLRDDLQRRHVRKRDTHDGMVKIEAVLPSYRMPSRTFTNWMTLKAAGVEMKLIYVPSETNDELSGFVPDKRNRIGQRHDDEHRPIGHDADQLPDQPGRAHAA